MELTQEKLGRLFRSLSALLHAGIGPAEGVSLLAQEERGSFSAFLQELFRPLEAGTPLSEAMEGRFPVWCTAMVRLGEDTGRLEEGLSFLADYCDEAVRTRHLLKQALAYPAGLFALMLLVIGLLLTKVLPVFDAVYASLGTGLTGLAGGLLALGQGLERALPVVFAGLLAALAMATGYGLSKGFRNYVNQFFQTHFSDRGLLRKFANARFIRAFAMGIASGLMEEEALSLASGLLAENPGAAKRCRQALSLLETGTALPEALEQTQLLPAACGRLLAVGLRSGNTDRILIDIANRMEQDARQALEEALAKLEPAMVLLCAGLVGVILLSVMVPLLDILAALG